MPESSDTERDPLELLHPFYLDADMSMAFAAALAGGVALQQEDVERSDQESQAVRNLRGNLKLFGLLGAAGGNLGAAAGRETSESSLASYESRLVRHHTEASIFITLYDELRRTHRIVQEPEIATLEAGQIVAFNSGPAVAPLRRVVDQILRLLDVAIPFLGDADVANEDVTGLSRQQRREQARQAAKHAMSVPEEDDDGASLRQLHKMLIALRDDLDRSGMIDVVVKHEDEPSIVLTLDKRFTSDQALELLHTARFTVIGKVTRIWQTEDEFVNLLRRSVMSLVPALAQTVTWGLFGLLAAMASGIDPTEAEAAARAAIGVGEPEEPTEKPEIMLGEDVDALHPGVTGPAIQILPLAICT